VVRNGLDDKLVPVRGVVDVVSGLGVFLNIQNRQVFIPAERTLSALRRLRSGEIVFLQVNRDFALREGLVAQGATNPAPAKLGFGRW
jgi:hypothetical protein